eukprot:CAMPEP_0174702790 /NCGR_PEP_ID=MMETSP1094-20130205/6955_1 /TAXON_ID=156173 /ORGANISM="Chrysochromulina brevifilum, Strain UTEX LB 985" /LENGTH=46 /DNA_ID= /DNA_START= /DNA_END= /DNA_ORIENTATION=
MEGGGVEVEEKVGDGWGGDGTERVEAERSSNLTNIAEGFARSHARL